jgi:hypothetical protein
MSLAIMAAALLAATPLLAATWRVELDGSGDFTEIQPAVDAAAAGDTIRIGPGRFATFHPIGLPGSFDEVIVMVTRPNLTFIGAGRDVTIVGPQTSYVPYARGPRAFFSLPPNTFALRSLTVENVYLLVFANNYVDIEDCSFYARDHRISCVTVYDSAARVESCKFTVYGGLGVVLNGPSSGAEISDCEFMGLGNSNPVNCSFGPRNVRVSDCTIANGGFIFHNTTGTVENCTFTNDIATALQVDMRTSSLHFSNISIAGGAQFGLVALGCNITAEGLLIAGTTTAAIAVSGLNSMAIHDSSFLPASGIAVHCNVSPSYPAQTLDLTRNNWGVTDAAAIDALIWDHRDDPNNPCTVLYEPYVGQPVSVEPTSWGDLKAIWR